MTGAWDSATMKQLRKLIFALALDRSMLADVIYSVFFKQDLFRSGTATCDLSNAMLANSRTVVLFEGAYDMAVIFVQTKKSVTFRLCST
jgi:hypothetical protein